MGLPSGSESPCRAPTVLKPFHRDCVRRKVVHLLQAASSPFHYHFHGFHCLYSCESRKNSCPAMTMNGAAPENWIGAFRTQKLRRVREIPALRLSYSSRTGLSSSGNKKGSKISQKSLRHRSVYYSLGPKLDRKLIFVVRQEILPRLGSVQPNARNDEAFQIMQWLELELFSERSSCFNGRILGDIFPPGLR
jgi:hypothetical protein